ncbi:MAG: hypothetical protein KBA72_10110 [Thermoanaerobaculia bacterium]|nr:hypothetical protein [Thermoanaerobaculia bacterium]
MSDRHLFPRLRWLGLAWLVVYLPSYAAAYGFTNFLFLCNLGVMLTAAALLGGSRLVLSSQAVAAPVIGIAWALDAGWRVVSGHHLFGGTEYMWDPQYPLFTRLLSLYHLAWPVLVVVVVLRVGYDRRGWPLQAAIAASAVVLSRLFTPPADNINFAFVDPIFGRAFEPAALHMAIVLISLAGVGYGLTHFALRAGAKELRGVRSAESSDSPDAAGERAAEGATAG